MKEYLGWTKAQWTVVLRWWYATEGQYLDADLLVATIDFDPEVIYTANRIKKAWLSAGNPWWFNPDYIGKAA